MSDAYQCDKCGVVKTGSPAGPDLDLDGDDCGLKVGDVTFELNDRGAGYDLCPPCFADLLHMAAVQAKEQATEQAEALKEKA